MPKTPCIFLLTEILPGVRGRVAPGLSTRESLAG